MIPFLAGLLFGFVSAIPVAGPVSALVLARSMAGRYAGARGIALGVGGAEALYATAAWWGTGELLVRYPLVADASRGITGVVLLGLGLAFALGWPKPAAPGDDGGSGFWGGVLLGFGLALLNPTFLATWSVAATAVLSSGWGSPGYESALAFGLGAGLGSGGWFSCVPSLVRRARGRLSPRLIAHGSRGTGWVLMGLAAFIIGSLVWG